MVWTMTYSHRPHSKDATVCSNINEIQILSSWYASITVQPPEKRSLPVHPVLRGSSLTHCAWLIRTDISGDYRQDLYDSFRKKSLGHWNILQKITIIRTYHMHSSNNDRLDRVSIPPVMVQVHDVEVYSLPLECSTGSPNSVSRTRNWSPILMMIFVSLNSSQ